MQRIGPLMRLRRATAILRARGIGSGHVGAWRLLALLSILALLLTPQRADARPFDTRTADWEACADLVGLARQSLGASHVQVVSMVDYSALTVDDAILIVHPEKTLDVGSLSRFMKAGGRVVLFDDFGTGDALLEHFGMGRIPAPAHPSQMLRSNPSLPLAEPASAHPTVADVQRVALNHPSALRHPNLSPVLRVRTNQGDDAIVAVAGTVQRGRFLAVSDASVVIDEMLRYGGNRAFAQGAVRYALDEDSWGKRGGTLYIATGSFEQKGRFGEEDGVASSIDDALRGVADFGRTVRQEGLPTSAVYVASLLLALLVVVWVARRSANRYRHRDPAFTARTPVLHQGGIAGKHALLTSGFAPRLLVALEWKLALEAELRWIFGVDAVPVAAQLPDALVARGLLAPSRQPELRSLLLELSRVETRLLAKGADLREKDVEGLALRTARILDELAAQDGRAPTFTKPA